MFKVYECGKLYFQLLRMRADGPLVEFAPTQEIDYPYRIGRCVILRAPYSTRAIAIGRWVGREADEDAAMLRALQARMEDLPTVDVDQALREGMHSAG